MPLLTYRDRSVFFIHIPKTGGSSLYLSMSRQGIRSRFFGSSRHCTQQHYHIELLEKHFPTYKDHAPFTIIRDPWSRTCSEYVWMTKNKASWDGFDEWLSKNLKKYTNHPFILDNHLRPQVEFIDSEVRVFVQHRHQEAQDYVNEQLRHTFDYSVRIHEFKYDPPTVDILSSDTYDLWRKIYARDIELFDDLR